MIVAPAFADDRTLNGFTADTLPSQSAGFIANRFGIRQFVLPSLSQPNGLKAFALGESVAVGIKLHPAVGLSGSMHGMFQVGGKSSDSNFKLDAAYKIHANGSLDVKIFRAEEIGAQWIFHLKTTYIRSNSNSIDTSRLSFNLDDTYYKGLKGQKKIDVIDVAKHLKDDASKLLKDNISKLSFSSEETYTGFGGAISWWQVFHPNIAMMAMADVSMGNSYTVDRGVKSLPVLKIQVGIGAAGCVSLNPMAPITMRVEYKHETFGNGTTNNVSNTVLGTIAYTKTGSPVSAAMSAGKLFVEKNSSPIGIMAIDYYF